MKKVKQTLKTDDLASSEGAGDQCIGELRTILETTHPEKSEEKVRKRMARKVRMKKKSQFEVQIKKSS